MNRYFRVLFITAVLATLLGASAAISYAEGGDEGDSAPAPKSAKRVTKGEKETDGTTAPNRFEADTVIKSQYKLNGEPLEVDPD
jgi:hypothetical protein